MGRRTISGFGSREGTMRETLRPRPSPCSGSDILRNGSRKRFPGSRESSAGRRGAGGSGGVWGSAASPTTRARLRYPRGRVAEAFSGFEGGLRRQEVVGEFGGVLVIDDFAHHPTAVRETIRGIRERDPGRPVTAVFEPRSNTSRRKIFQEEFAEALSGSCS